MNDYILKQDNSILHFFTIPNQGIAVRTKKLNLWHNHRVLLPGSVGAFSVFQDEIQGISLVAITPANEIQYTIIKGSEEKSFILTKLKEEMVVKNISLFKTPIGMNIIYTAGYLGKLLLVHCVLGNNARPDTIDEIKTQAYAIYNNAVYYTNSAGVLGYKNLSDGKADIFNSITSGASYPYLYNLNGRDLITYIKDDKIHLQNRPIIHEPDAKNPIIFENDGMEFLMWQKGDFIRYTKISDEGTTFAPVMQYVSSGKVPILINVINGGSIYKYFAAKTTNDIKIFGNPDIFLKPKTSQSKSSFSSNEGFRLLLDMEKNEVVKIKNHQQKSDNF